MFNLQKFLKKSQFVRNGRLLTFYVFLPTKDIVLRKSFNLLQANFQNTVENNNQDNYIQKDIQMLMFDASHEK